MARYVGAVSGAMGMADERSVAERLEQVLESLGNRIARRDREAVALELSLGDHGAALVRIAQGLCERDSAITRAERSELLDLARLLETDEVVAAVDMCTEAEPDLLDVLAGYWATAKRKGRAVFVVVMAAVFMVCAAVGIANAKDAIDGQPVIWGTYTQVECRTDLKGCRSYGTWVSDDGTIVKTGIQLDGSPGSDGTVRASYKPAGLMNDEDNNIVHEEAWSTAGLWMPWLLCLLIVGMTVFYVRSWSRDSAAARH